MLGQPTTSQRQTAKKLTIPVGPVKQKGCYESTRKHNLAARKAVKRWQKAVHATALHHERTTNKRKDFIGKLVYNLYHNKQKNVLVAEDLGVSNMVQNRHLSKSISDAAWRTSLTGVRA